MKEFKVYKNIRREALIFGMPIGNFGIMSAIMVALFLTLLKGVSFFKIIFIIVAWIGTFIFFRFIYNTNSSSGKIDDYKRF